MMIIIMLVTSAGILIVCGSFFLLQHRALKQNLVHQLTIDAQIIGKNCAASILFNDPRAAEQDLAALGLNPELISARILRSSGQVFAAYQSHRSSFRQVQEVLQSPGYLFTHNRVYISQHVDLKNGESAQIDIECSLNLLNVQLRDAAFSILVIALLTVAATFGLARWFQNFISQPISNLKEAMARVSTNQDYSERLPLRGKDEVASLTQSFNTMLSELEQRDARIRRHAEERDRIEREVAQASEREQRRIGNELHDVLAQDLLAIQMLSGEVEESIKNKLGNNEEERIRRVRGLVTNSIEMVRNLSRGLYPHELERLGFDEALQHCAESAEIRYGISCRYRSCGKCQIEEFTALNLYRITQEAVTNAGKHSHAQHIDIQTYISNNRFCIEVKDDGNGYRHSEEEPGMGLRIMKHRCNLIGATLSISSSEHNGTMVQCSLPCETRMVSPCVLSFSELTQG